MISWARWEEDLIRAGYAEGKPVREIAERVRRGYAEVIGKAKRMGLTHPTATGGRACRTKKGTQPDG